MLRSPSLSHKFLDLCFHSVSYMSSSSSNSLWIPLKFYSFSLLKCLSLSCDLFTFILWNKMRFIYRYPMKLIFCIDNLYWKACEIDGSDHRCELRIAVHKRGLDGYGGTRVRGEAHPKRKLPLDFISLILSSLILCKKTREAHYFKWDSLQYF